MWTNRLSEQHYAEDADDDLVRDAVDAIGYCARVVPESRQQGLTALISFIQSPHGTSKVYSLYFTVLNIRLRLTLHHQPQTS